MSVLSTPVATILFSIKNLRSLRNSSSTGFPRYDVLMIEMMSSNTELYFVYLAAEAILSKNVSLIILQILLQQSFRGILDLQSLAYLRITIGLRKEAKIIFHAMFIFISIKKRQQKVFSKYKEFLAVFEMFSLSCALFFTTL